MTDDRLEQQAGILAVLNDLVRAANDTPSFCSMYTFRETSEFKSAEEMVAEMERLEAAKRLDKREAT